MKRHVLLFPVLLLMAAAAHASGPLVVKVDYLGHGQYVFKKTAYDHTSVVQAIQAKYQGEHIDLVAVSMPAGASLADRRDVCLLRGELGTQVKMHLDVGDGTTTPQFCN